MFYYTSSDKISLLIGWTFTMLLDLNHNFSAG